MDILDSRTLYIKMSRNSRIQLFNKYKRDSVRRDIEFGISLPYFSGVISRSCHYCDCPPSSVFKNGKKSRSYELLYNGIDRIDNERGYLKRNCVSCCKRCNFAKSKLTKEEFLDMVKEIYNKHFTR